MPRIVESRSHGGSGRSSKKESRSVRPGDHAVARMLECPDPLRGARLLILDARAHERFEAGFAVARASLVETRFVGCRARLRVMLLDRGTRGEVALTAGAREEVGERHLRQIAGARVRD